MKYKKLIDNTKIPVIGLGTWLIGGGMEADYSEDEQAIRAIKTAIELGYRHIDTAEMYGDGHTEELIGKAIKDINRDELFITTKVRKTKLKYNEVLRSAEESLNKMGIDYIDLFLVHAPSQHISIEETMKAFDYLVDQKMVRHIGVSNFQVHQLIEAQRYTKNKIVANQIEYSLLTRNKGKYADNRDMELKTIPYCQENNILIIAERPLERGLILQNHPILDALELKYGKTKAQIAINWLISKKNIITIPKSTNKQRLIENFGSIGWELEKDDIKLLDAITFPRIV